MSNIRTANKRHKRALTLTIARGKPSETTPLDKVKPVKAQD